MKLTIPKSIARFAGAALFAAAAVLTARATDYPTTLLSHSPVGYWRFNDSVTSPPLAIVTNAGTLGNIATGYVVNNGSTTPILGSPGLIGTSARFNNPGNTVGLEASKIEVPWNAALNSKPPFSIEFWANPNSLGADGTGFQVVENFDPSMNNAGNRSGWLFYLNNVGRWQLRLGAFSGYALNLSATGGNATPGTWQHIVATWDGVNVVLYANGTVIGTGTASLSVWHQNTESFIRMGGSPLTGNNAVVNANSESSTIGNRGYDGYLQHFAIYNTVLSPSQVNAHYMAASTNNAGYIAQIKADAPVGYWPLNDAPIAIPTGPFPLATNSGNLGSAADATNDFGALVGQPGPGYTGFAADTNAVFFDGVNGSMQVDDAAGLHFTGPITLTAWVKPIEQDYFRDIIAHGFNAADAETFLRISRGPLFTGGFQFFNADASGDGNYYEIGASDGGNYYDAAQFPIPPGDIGNWVFLAGTCDGSTWNLYRNGALVATAPVDTADGAIGAYNITGPWTVGSRQQDSVFQGQGENFGGSIFQPAIFNSTLTAGDIQALYLAALVPPVITQAPVTPGTLVQGTVIEGSSFSLSVWAEGNPTLAYQWYQNGARLSGQTATNYGKASAIVADSGTYSVVITNNYGSVTSSVSFVVLPSAPIITSQPSPVNRYVGYPYSFSVSDIGSSPLSFQWQTNGVPVPGANSATYSNIAQLSFGGNFTVVLSNYLGSITSSPALFTVLSVPSGYPAAVVGSSPLSYWRLDESSGTVAHDLISGNNGVYNSTTLGLPGYSILDPDTAAGFSGNNSYVGSISGTAINFIDNANFTLEAWVNAPDGQNDQASIIAKGIGNNGTTETEQFSLDVAGGAYRFFTTRSGTIYSASASTGPNGTWQHVVGVYDGQNALGGGVKMYIYVNGELEGSGPCPTGQSPTTSQVSIGSKRTGNDPTYDGTFDGTVDEVAVYNTALSASTVFAHYAAAYGTTLAPFINVEPVPVTNYLGLPIKLSVAAAGSVPLTYTWYQGNTVVGNASIYFISSAAFSDAGYYYVNIANGLGNTNSVTNYVAVLAPPTSPPAIPGLVVHLPFNGNLTDVTGRGNDGTGKHSTKVPGGNSGTTNTVSPGPATSPNFYYVTDSPFPGTNALHYSTTATNSGGTTANGASGGVDDYYVTLGVRPDLQFGSNVNFSVAFWVRTPLGYGLGPDYGGGGDLPFFTTALTSLGGFGYDFATAYAYGTANPIPPTGSPVPPVGTGGWACSFYNNGATGVRIYGATGSINDGNWHSLVYVVNRATGLVTTYLDGVVAGYTVAGGTTLTAAGNIDSGNPAVIGQDPTGLYGENGSADISDFGVWRKALTPLEAAAIYAAGFDSGLSYAYVPSTFTSTHNSSTITLTWSFGTLQSATSVGGPYTDVSSGSPYTTSSTTGNQFFRVRYTYQ